MKTRAWNVWLGQNIIDTVFYGAECDAEYVCRTLVEHDNYPPEIRVSLDKHK